MPREIVTVFQCPVNFWDPRCINYVADQQLRSFERSLPSANELGHTAVIIDEVQRSVTRFGEAKGVMESASSQVRKPTWTRVRPHIGCKSSLFTLLL